MNEAIVLDYLREQFALLHAKFDAIQGNATKLKAPTSAPEAEIGHVRIGEAELNGRLDRIEARIDRVERRLELVG